MATKKKAPKRQTVNKRMRVNSAHNEEMCSNLHDISNSEMDADPSAIYTTTLGK